MTNALSRASMADSLQAQLEPAEERRVITIFFADVVGSTTLAQNLDPEEWRELDDDNRLAEIYHRRAQYARETADYRAGLRAADEAVAAARRAGNPLIEVQALSLKALAQTHLGENEPEQARAAAEGGYRELMDRAGKISDPEWRKSFLENVAEHRAIGEMWEELSRQRKA